MLKKNIEKQERKNRPLWNGYYTRKTPTKREKMDKIANKHRVPLCADQDKEPSKKLGSSFLAAGSRLRQTT